MIGKSNRSKNKRRKKDPRVEKGVSNRMTNDRLKPEPRQEIQISEGASAK